MFNSKGTYFSEDETWYRSKVLQLLEVIKECDTIVEINTRGYYKYTQLDLYPSQWVSEHMAQLGVRVQVNADAHKPEEINAGTDYGIEKIKAAGHREVWVLDKGNWIPKAI